MTRTTYIHGTGVFARALALSALLCTGTAIADAPTWAGDGEPHKNDGRDSLENTRAEQRHDGRHEYFGDRQRTYVREYYSEHYRGRRCPQGLAKTQHGCTAPELTRQWQFGQPLARTVTYYRIPEPLLVRIGLAPSGHRYARVGSDILLMSVGTGVIVDAIEDLGRL